MKIKELVTGPQARGTFVGTELEGAKLAFDARREIIKGEAPDVYNAIYGDVPTMQVVDHAYVAAKVAGEVTAYYDLFKSDDNIATGLASLSEGKPPAKQFFIITHIMLQYAVAAGTTDAQVAAATYGIAPSALLNGNFKLEQGSRILIPELPCSIFSNPGNGYTAIGDTNVAAGTAITYTMVSPNAGLYRLSNPKFIYPQEKLDLSLKFAAALASANACVKVTVIGAANVSI